MMFNKLGHYLFKRMSKDQIALRKTRPQNMVGLYINSKDLDSLTAMYQVDDDRYYRILEIEKTATQDEIKSAYRKMAKKYHPDKLGDIGEEARKAGNEKFRQVQEAYENLYKQ